jgi:mannose-6-phosphate isomerase-like protein (cupin superfamily)
VHTWFEPGGHLPEHFHPSLEEHWEVVEGTARVKLDGTVRSGSRRECGTSSRTTAAGSCTPAAGWSPAAVCRSS